MKPKLAWTAPSLWLLSIIGGLVAPGMASAHVLAPEDQDLVAVAIVDEGQGILLATPGLERDGRKMRFRFLDTSALRTALSRPVLSASGTKLLVQRADDVTLVFDLTKRNRVIDSVHHVDRRDPAADGRGGRHVHRLPSQRFAVIRGGLAYILDDLGAVRPEYPVVHAADAVVLPDGTVFYHRPGAVPMVCGERPEDRSHCRELPPTATDDGDTRTEAGLRSSVRINQHPIADAAIKRLLDTLSREAPQADGVLGRPLGDWYFFPVTPDPELYLPVLEVAREEEVFPGPFETLERLRASRGGTQSLFDRYLQQDLEERRRNCTIYFRVRSDPGAWTIEYWLYYPFDIGGLQGHLHDPEHVFVEVDMLGGSVHRVVAAAHGFLAGNNIYSTTRTLARPADLPLFVMVEFNKHATASDMNRDGKFTPGIDENEYRERAKVWGVRDVVGTNNNHLLPYDATMTLPRHQEDYLASINVMARFPHEQRLADRACCRLIPLPAEPVRRTTCQAPTTDCAIASVMRHPDFVNRTTVLKDWVFPQSFLRATYGLGPGLGVHTAGLGYSTDLDRTPVLGQVLPLPGRIGVEAFGWQREAEQGLGYGVRYEQFLSNLFGIHSGLRVYSPPVSNIWITFGPMVEVPLRNSGNVNLMTGLSLLPGGSPSFEIRVSAGFWKRRVASVGIAAGS